MMLYDVAYVDFIAEQALACVERETRTNSAGDWRDLRERQRWRDDEFTLLAEELYVLPS